MAFRQHFSLLFAVFGKPLAFAGVLFYIPVRGVRTTSTAAITPSM